MRSFVASLLGGIAVLLVAGDLILALSVGSIPTILFLVAALGAMLIVGASTVYWLIRYESWQ